MYYVSEFEIKQVVSAFDLEIVRIKSVYGEGGHEKDLAFVLDLYSRFISQSSVLRHFAKSLNNPTFRESPRGISKFADSI